MIKKKELGQAFILVLIILAIGALVVVPTLRLTTTVLKSNQVITQRTRGLYACEAAQEYVMWMLLHGTLVDELGHEAGGSSANFTVDVCGTTVYASVVMRAMELEGGVVLAGDHTIMPMKTVSPDQVISKSDTGPFTYTIALEQVSDNNTNGLDVIYDIMSDEFSGKAEDLYVPNSSYISDDGINWGDPISDPKTDYNSNALLRWPATGNFSSPFRDFTPGQTKYLKFDMTGPFKHDDIVVCNWVAIQVGDVFTLSGPQAGIEVRNPTEAGCADGAGGVFVASKTSDPTVIPPLQPTDVTYTVTIQNLQGSSQFIQMIEDYLPPGFTYVGPTTTNMTTPENQGPNAPQLVTVNGVERYKLVWDETQLGTSGSKVSAGANVTLVFVARAEQGISGNYYNEVVITPKGFPDPNVFNDIPDFPEGGYGETYSWNSGIVIVPAYDSQTTADGENITANMALEPDHIRILSWNVE